MIPPGYAILISAIVIIASLMLYARFFARSRMNSNHRSAEGSDTAELRGEISPDATLPGGDGDRVSGDDHLFVLPADSMDSAVRVEPSGFRETRDEFEQMDEGSSDPELVAKPSKQEQDGQRDSDYFDDLQEAAAGLARLMRSSPVNKASSSNTKPVIFAPEESGDSETDAPGSIVLPIFPSESLEADSELSKSAHDSSDFSDDPSDSAGNEGDTTAKISAELLLGEPGDDFDSDSSESIQIEVADLESSRETESSEEDHEITEPIYPLAEEAIELRDVNTLFDDSIELVDSETSAEDSVVDEPVMESPEARKGAAAPNRLRLLLGDEVGDSVDAIDEGLDELETLVVSIESSLASLDMSVLEESELVSVAA